MATMMIMRWKGITPELYDEVRRKVGWEEDPAEGGILHVCAFDDDGMRITDVWESPEHFQRFGESRLMPVVKEIGIDSEPEVELLEIHATFAPDSERINA